MPVYYDLEAVERRLDFHERRVVELELTGENPQQLAQHKKLVRRFRAARLDAVYGPVDITKYT